MEIIRNGFLEGERALFFGRDLRIEDSVFDNGESPLKHSSNIELIHSSFKWKYPIWYSDHVRLTECVLTETARAGIWYTSDLQMENVKIDAPKTFRRSSGLILRKVDFTNAQETLWACRDVEMEHVTAKGDYFAMNSRDLKIKDLDLLGNYGFDGGENIEISDSKLITKDAFWNCRNITVKNSYISGEYFGWNSENIVLENCTLESLQGMCYIKGLVMKNCKLIDTTLSFEYSEVDAEIEGHIDSVKNPSSGRIHAGSIGELIMEEDRVDTGATIIETEE